MKNLLLTAAFLIAAITTANAQSVTIGNVTITYNAEAAKNIGLAVDVSDKTGYLATCKDATSAIYYLTKELHITLTPTQQAAIYGVARQETPAYLKKAAGIVTL